MDTNVKTVPNIKLVTAVFTVYLLGSLLQLTGHLVRLGGQVLPELLEAPVRQPGLHRATAAAGTCGAELQAGL